MGSLCTFCLLFWKLKSTITSKVYHLTKIYIKKNNYCFYYNLIMFEAINQCNQVREINQGHEQWRKRIKNIYFYTCQQEHTVEL